VVHAKTRSESERRFSAATEEARHLPAFIAVAEELHFGRAAKLLKVSQPTLSRRIRMLEEQLGTALFDRGNQPIRLTPAGSAFMAEAKLAQHHSRRALEQARRAARGELGRLTLGAISWANNSIVPYALRAFHAKAPSVSLELYTTSPGAQVEALQKQRLDVGFSAFARWMKGRPGLELEPILEEPMVALLPQDHSLARRQAVSLADLASERLIVLADAVTPGLVDKQVSIFHERGLSPADVHETHDPWALQALVAAGIGVGLHMASFSNVRHRGIAFVPLEGDGPTATLLMLSRRGDKRELVRSFLSTTREIARSLESPEVLRNG
jgi:DNA-binding transcriptional LysR family regulator